MEASFKNQNIQYAEVPMGSFVTSLSVEELVTMPEVSVQD